MASSEPIRVLLIEDDGEYLELLREMVQGSTQSHFRVTGTRGDLAGGIEAMLAGIADVVLLDLNLPDSRELQTFIRAHEAVPTLPIIILSGFDDEDFAAEAVHLGAQDYLVKSRTDAHLLQRALRYAVERSRSEAQFSRERDLLNTLLESIPDRVYFKDRDSRFIRINHALMELFQLARPDEIYGKSDADFYDPEHSAEARADEERVMETGEPIFNKVESEVLEHGGKVWSVTTKLPLRDRQDRIIGTCGISRDITGMKAMEEQLAGERDLLNTLLDNIPDRIYFKDRASRFIRINRALTDFFHLQKPEEAYGRTDADFFGHEHAQQTLADEQQIIETGEPILGKIECKTPVGGRKSWTLTTKLPLRDQQGNIVGTCGISREITVVKEMEERLASERNLLRSVIDNLPDSIFLKDTECRYVLDNVAHYRSLAASDPSEVLGRTSFDFYPDDIAQHFHEDDLAVMRRGAELMNREECVPNIHGKPRWMLTTKLPWRSESGEILGLLCIARDITEQRESAENLRLAYAELAYSREEVLAAMAKIQAAHQELRDVQLQLIDAEKMKSIGRLAAGVAHEVKNPLAIVRMGLEFLTQAPANDENTILILKEMADAVQRADDVVRGLLDFSAPKRLDVKREDLNAIIDQGLKLVRGEMKPGVKIVRELQRKLPPIELDAAKMSQVFVNLFTNALHAINENGTLSVRTYSKQLTGVGANISGARSESFRVGSTLVVVEIDDTGHGIPEDKLAKIFEPFFTTKPTGVGTGLGLSVVKTIVDLHGATIDVRNLPEEGARVTIMFQV